MGNEPNAFHYSSIPRWKRRAILIVVLGLLLTPFILWPRFMGISVAVLLMAVPLLWFAIKWKIRRLLKGLDIDDWGGRLPETMPLTAAPNVKWKHVRAVLSNQEALSQLGFSPIGTFRADEYTEGLRIAAAISADRKTMGLVYDEKHGSYVEFLARTADDEFIAFTNGGYADTKCVAESKSMKQYMEMSAAELFNGFMAFAPHRQREELDPETFAYDYACFYGSKREWFEEEGDATGDDDLLEEFLEECEWGAGEWEKKRSRVFFIHDRMTLEEVAEQYVEVLGDLSTDYQGELTRAQASLAGLEPRAGFTKLLAEGRLKDRVEYVMDMEGSRQADVYLGPAPMAWD